MSADGYIDDASDRLLLSNDADFDRADAERAASDAILVGASTIRRDKPRGCLRRVRLGEPIACASSTLTASARDTKRGLAGVAHVDSYLQSLGGEICLILPPSERTCRRLSQDVASRETLRNRKVTNTKSSR